ncbi:hypothetical protein HOY82DRAFT_598032 [Tuber indicum]|nr:hypothetical protein HOY82DRAFT_598032 [Tuber indicum]
MGSIGDPQRGRSRITCHTVGGKLAIVRGTEEPSIECRRLYDVIGGNGEGGATLTGLADDKDFARGLGKLFAAAVNRTTSPNPAAATYNSIDAIVGGVIGGVALLAIIGAGIWKLLRRYVKSNLVPEARI